MVNPDDQRISELVNRFEIQNLLEEYAWNVDHGHWDRWVQLFSEDGVFRVWDEDFVGRPAILKQVEETYARLGFLRHHFMLPSIVFPGPDQARVRLYFQLVGATKGGHELVGAGAYISDLVRTSRWQIRRHEVLFDYLTRLDQGWAKVERGWVRQPTGL